MSPETCFEIYQPVTTDEYERKSMNEYAIINMKPIKYVNVWYSLLLITCSIYSAQLAIQLEIATADIMHSVTEMPSLNYRDL